MRAELNSGVSRKNINFHNLICTVNGLLNDKIYNKIKNMRSQ